MAEIPPEDVISPVDRGLTHERPLGLSSSIVFVIGVVIQGVGFIGNYFTSHHIGYEQIGLTALGVAGLFLTISSTVNGMADLRIGSAYTYFIARGRKPEELTATYAGVRLSLVVLVSLGLFLLAPLFYFTQGATTCLAATGCQLTIPSRTEIEIFGVFMIAPLLWSPGTIYSQLWVARGDSVRSQFPLLVQSAVQTIGLVTVALLGPPPIEALWGLAFSYLAGGAASAIYSTPAVVRLWHEFKVPEVRKMFVYAWPLMGGLVLGYLWTTAPTFFVATLSGGAVAVFLAANGFRVLLLGLPTAVAMPLFPHLTNLHVRREYEQLRRRTWAALRYTAMIVVPASIAMVVYRTPLLNVLFVGTTYAAGAVPLAILAVSAIPAALSQIILTALSSVGRQRLDLYLTGVQVAVLLGVAFLVLPPFAPLGNEGLMGAAIAVLASSLASFALNVYFVERALAIRVQPRPIAAIVLSAAASFFVVSRLNAYISPSRFYILFPAILLGFAAYFLVLAATGELSKRDVERLAHYVGLPRRVGSFFARFCWADETRDAGEMLGEEHAAESDERLDATRLSETGDGAFRRRG
ncbi:MAG TPA: polysaccharide biosynthesis C-terminal domain-containing protein [Thermoplasmata archaeon]|nr:polysaccharide biosynthesis C-terminal domain-containing protein [Thermoplasmata archaeon]